MNILSKMSIGLSALCMAALAVAATPFKVHYSGRLTTNDGRPVQGPIDLSLSFFPAEEGGAPLAVTPQVFPAVELREGMFSVELMLTPTDYHLIFSGTGLTYVQVTDVTRGQTYPRQTFGAVPYALKVPVDGTSISYNANGELEAIGVANVAHATTADSATTASTATTADHATTAGSATTAAHATTADSATTATTATTATNALGLMGVELGAGPPGPGQILKYSDVTGKWELSSDDGGGTGGEVNTASSAGGTASVYKQKVLENLVFRGLSAGAGASVTQNANDITIAADVTTVAGRTGAVTLDADDVAETFGKRWLSLAEQTKLSGIAAGADMLKSVYDANSDGKVDAAATADAATNATQLDGQTAAFYRNASNLNAGTVGESYIDATVARDAEVPDLARSAFSATAPLAYDDVTGVFSLGSASTSTNGYLSSTDWNTFNGKQTALDAFSNVTLNQLVAKGHVRLDDDDATQSVTIKAADTTNDTYTLSLPADAPDSDGQLLAVDTSGQLSWVTPGGGGDMMASIYGSGGSGTVNNSDKLGGNAPSYYRNASNINAGTLAESYVDSAVARDAEVPALARGALSGTAPITFNGTTGAIGISNATASAAGAMSAADKTKLDGIATGANVTDATTVEAAGAIMDSDFSVVGLMKRTGAGAYTSITDNSANWDSAYSTVNANGANWNSAYADRLKWDGGATGLDATTARTSLGLVIGTNVQAYDAGLTSIAGLTTGANQMIYTTGADTYETTALTAAGRALLDDADAATQRTTLGLGTMATQNAGSVAITGGTVEGATIGGAPSIAVGTASPHASALLDVTSTVKGFLPPRMTTAQRDAIGSPANGLVVYNTTTSSLNFYNGTWQNVKPESISWTTVTTDTNMSVNSGYIVNSASLVNLTLPSACGVGDRIKVSGYGVGGWKILQQNAGHVIRGAFGATTVGTTGYLKSRSSNGRDAIEITCVVTNDEWAVTALSGEIGAATLIQHTQTAADTADRKIYTFAGHNLGTPSPDRKIVICVGAIETNAQNLVETVTVAGVAATQVTYANHTATDHAYVGMYVASVPTGTTGDVVVTMQATAEGAGISTFSLIGASSTPHATRSDSTGTHPVSLTIDAPTNSAVIACSQEYGGDQTYNWTNGVTKQGEVDVNSGEYFSSATASMTNGNPSLVINATASSGTPTQIASVAAVFKE